MPLVSVVIPAFNPGRYLDEAVQSVIAQTFTDWECIVVDDGSTEDLSRVEKIDTRVRLIRQPNAGASAARNAGMMAGGGDYIAFLDADDIWNPNKLDMQVLALAENPSAAYCHTGFDYLSHDGRSIWPGWDGRATASPADASRNVGAILFATGLVRRRCLPFSGLFDPLLRGAEDMDFILRLARNFTILALPQRLYLYRQHANNTTRNYDAMRAATAEVFRRHRAAARAQGETALDRALALCDRDFRRVFGAQAYDAARQSLGRRDFAAFLTHLRRAVTWSPAQTLASIAKFPSARMKRRRKTSAKT